MAISRKEIEALQCSDALKRRILKDRECCVTFANTDLLPTECSWYISVEQMEKMVADIARSYLGNEVTQATVRTEYAKNGGMQPMAYVWLRKDSKHLTDKNIEAPSSGVSVTGSKYSKELIELVDLYAAEYDLHGNFIPRNKRVDIRGEGEESQSRRRTESNIVAVALDLVKILERLFDSNNAGFADVYGTDAPAKTTRLQVEGKRKRVSKSDDFEKRGPLRGFKITKCYSASPDRELEKPIPAFRDASFAKNGFDEEDPFRRGRRSGNN